MRVRCSAGDVNPFHLGVDLTTLSLALRISTTFYGNFYQSSPTDLEFGVFDADKAVSLTFEHSGSSLTSREFVFLQCALLYTSVSGQRRARICNIALQVVELAGSVFQFADLDATICHLAREGQLLFFSPCRFSYIRRCQLAMMLRTKQKISTVRENLTEKCASILLSYRKQCAASTRPSQVGLCLH